MQICVNTFNTNTKKRWILLEKKKKTIYKGDITWPRINSCFNTRLELFIAKSTGTKPILNRSIGSEIIIFFMDTMLMLSSEKRLLITV